MAGNACNSGIFVSSRRTRERSTWGRAAVTFSIGVIIRGTTSPFRIDVGRPALRQNRARHQGAETRAPALHEERVLTL